MQKPKYDKNKVRTILLVPREYNKKKKKKKKKNRKDCRLMHQLWQCLAYSKMYDGYGKTDHFKNVQVSKKKVEQ